MFCIFIVVTITILVFPMHVDCTWEGLGIFHFFGIKRNANTSTYYRAHGISKEQSTILVFFIMRTILPPKVYRSLLLLDRYLTYMQSIFVSIFIVLMIKLIVFSLLAYRPFGWLDFYRAHDNISCFVDVLYHYSFTLTLTDKLGLAFRHEKGR